MPIEATIDHTGPMTQTVMDNAVMLEVLAGPDGLDPRQYDVVTDKYSHAVTRGVSGLRIGIVKEGFERPESESDVDAKNRAAAEMFKRMGATVDEISIPWHEKGPAIWTPIAVEGLTNQMMHGNGMGTGWEGMYTTSLLDFHANWRQRADELSDTLKICMFIGQYYLKHHRGHYYAKSQNLARQLREEYNKVLASYDLLLMPTTPMKADAAASLGRAAGTLVPARLRDVGQHSTIRRDRPPGHGHPMRDVGRIASQHDVGGQALRGVHDLPRRRSFRGRGRLEGDVSVGPAI